MYRVGGMLLTNGGGILYRPPPAIGLYSTLRMVRRMYKVSHIFGFAGR